MEENYYAFGSSCIECFGLADESTKAHDLSSTTNKTVRKSLI